MKLRIRGNSLRLRVTRSELAEIESAGRCEDSIRFPGGASLVYRIVVDDAAGETAARFDGSHVTVSLPPAVVETWAGSDQVSIEAAQPLDDGQRLALLVEKDFSCLVPRTGEDTADTFPNPAAADMDGRRE